MVKFLEVFSGGSGPSVNWSTVDRYTLTGVVTFASFWMFDMLAGAGVTTGDVIAVVLAFLGFIGTTSMLIMNLKVSSALSELKGSFEKELAKVELRIESARSESSRGTTGVQLELANLRTKLAEELSNMYNQVMRNMENTYMNRQTSITMHEANQKRLDLIERRLTSMEERLPS